MCRELICDRLELESILLAGRAGEHHHPVYSNNDSVSSNGDEQGVDDYS